MFELSQICSASLIWSGKIKNLHTLNIRFKFNDFAEPRRPPHERTFLNITVSRQKVIITPYNQYLITDTPRINNQQGTFILKGKVCMGIESRNKRRGCRQQ